MLMKKALFFIHNGSDYKGRQTRLSPFAGKLNEWIRVHNKFYLAQILDSLDNHNYLIKGLGKRMVGANCSNYPF